jgi:hypothetical protein
MSIWTLEADPVPREVFVRFTCDGCGRQAQGSVTGHGGDPVAVARKAAFVIDQNDHHWCPSCAKSRPTTEQQLGLAL